MALESVHKAIAGWFDGAFAALMTARGLTVPILWPGDKRASLAPPFARFQFQPVASRIPDIGGIVFGGTTYIEDVEQVAFEVYVRDGSGWLQIDQIVDDARRLFTVAAASPSLVGGARFGEIESHAPRVAARGPDGVVGNHLRAVVIAPYRFEHTA